MAYKIQNLTSNRQKHNRTNKRTMTPKEKQVCPMCGNEERSRMIIIDDLAHCHCCGTDWRSEVKQELINSK